MSLVQLRGLNYFINAILDHAEAGAPLNITTNFSIIFPYIKKIISKKLIIF